MWVSRPGDPEPLLVEDATFPYWRSRGYVEWTPDAGPAGLTVEDVVASPALRAAYVAARLPSYAGTRTNPFDAQRSIYNLTPSSAHSLRARLRGAVTGRVRIAMMGHSMVGGSFATNGSTDMPTQLRQRLAALGYSTGTGICYIDHNNGQGRDPRYTALDPAWVGTANRLSFPFFQCSASGKAATFVSDLAGTAVDVAIIGTSSPLSVSIDGGAAQTITPNGTGTLQVASFTGLANSAHTVVVTTTSAAPAYLVGVGVRGTVGVEVSNLGIGSTKASDWIPTVGGVGSAGFNNFGISTGLSPHMAFVQLDANDALNNVSAATFKTNMQAILGGLRTKGIPFALIASPSMVPGGSGYNAVSQPQWEALLVVLYDLADQYDVPLADMTHRFVDWPTSNADGLMADRVHPGPAGYRMIADSATYILA